MNTTLIRFLAHKGALLRFVHNCYRKKANGTAWYSRESVLKNISQVEPIKSSFIWVKTPEGYHYWSKLHDEYTKLSTVQ